MTATEDNFWCVVPAAGRGTRFGSELPKQYVELAGKPLLSWTLERLFSHPRIAGIVVVLAADDRYWSDLKPHRGKPLLNVVGGTERSDSVLAGLHAVPQTVAGDAFVLVHDAARPCVRHADIDTLIRRGSEAGGGLLAAPVRDTLKRSDKSCRVLATDSRESRWRALTPQMFRRAELIAALESSRQAGVIVSDEAMAMERAGFSPLLVEGCDDNIKVTTPADLAFAEYLLLRVSGIGNR